MKQQHASRSKVISMHPRPFPHFNVGYIPQEKELAKALRKEFIPKITRRLPGHHLRGHSHDFIVKYVANQKDVQRFDDHIHGRRLDFRTRPGTNDRYLCISGK